MPGPDKRRGNGPFRLIDVDEEREESVIQRTSGPEPAPFALARTGQKEFLVAIQSVQVGLQRVEEGQAKLFRGQSDLTEAFGRQAQAFNALVPRVKKLEERAQWKVWAIRAAKTAVPILAMFVGRYAPELVRHVPAILEFLEHYALETTPVP